LTEAKKSLLVFILFLVIFEGITAAFAFKQDTWGDERHFVETIKFFGDEISFKSLKHYNEMSTPFPFLLYAAWGRVFNFDLNTLRLLSILLALITYLAFYYLLTLFINNRITVLLAAAFFVLHPYMVGFSVFVFTDMLPLTASIFCLIALKKNKPVLFMISAMIGILSRQYFLFFSGAAGLFYLLKYWYSREKADLKMVTATALSLLPLIFLFVFWGGFSPVNKINHLYLDEAFTFHFEYLTLYIFQLFVYLLPFVIFRRKYFYSNRRVLFFSLLISVVYFIFPVEPCKASVEVGLSTVGYFHKLIQITMSQSYEHIIFYLGFLLGWPVLITIIIDIYKRLTQKKYDFIFLLNLAIISFLVIMPFSYLLWEKYFMPLVPLAILQILLVYFEDVSTKKMKV